MYSQVSGVSAERERRSTQESDLFSELRQLLLGERTFLDEAVVALPLLSELATLENSGHVQAALAYLDALLLAQ